MTETITKKDPFDFLFYYEFDSGEREEDALLVGGDDPSTASPLHLAMGIKDAGKIVISPIPDVTTASSSNYHFKLQFTPGILLQPEHITVEDDDWDLKVEGDTILYLLWKKEEEFTLDDSNSLELMLKGVMGTLATALRASQTNVTLSWEFKRDGITIIDVTAVTQRGAPGDGGDGGDTNPSYNNTITETLEMIQRQGKANIPLYVGFFSSNRVLNTHNQESELKLRITNMSESPITFKYNTDATNRSQLVIALEVGNADTVPWALGTADQVNNVEVSIAGDKWQKTAGPENKGSTLEWTFSPKSADVPLAAKDTLVVELRKIVTAHPTGTANLYLRYTFVSGYQAGEFICPIEKAPLVFPEKNVGIGTSIPSKKFEVVGSGSSEQLVSLSGDNDLSLALRSSKEAEVYYELADGNNGIENSWKIGTNDDGKLHFGYGKVGSFNSNEKMTVLTTGEVGIGTTSPEAKLHVKGGDAIFSGNLNFGHRNGQKLNLYSNVHGIGVQGSTTYFRTSANFAWFKGGSHNDGVANPGDGGSLQMVLNSSGNVGIGTTSPKQTLHIAGDYYGKGHMWLYANEGDGNTGTAYVQARDDSGKSTIDLRLRTQENGQAKDVMHLDSSGNVGIGTTSPQAKLDVNGTIKSTSLKIGNTVIGENELKILKRLAADQLVLRLKTSSTPDYNNQYLYASSLVHEKRREVACWTEGNAVIGSNWRVEVL